MGAYIKENWLFVVVAVYLVSMVLYGHYRGFIRLAVSAVSLVLSLGVVHFGAPSVANLLRSNEVVYQMCWFQKRTASSQFQILKSTK